jgi:hypothetical protein
MRTTVTIDDSLYANAKVHAAQSGRGVGAVIEDALRDYLERATSAHASDFVPLPTMRSGGVRPGIDLNDMSSVYELLDEGEGLNALR